MSDQKTTRKIDMKRIEANVIDLIAAITPWLSPLIPSYLVFKNMSQRLDYTELFSLIGAAAVEFLGLSAVYTATTFWNYNADRKTGRAPFLIALLAGLFYVVIILVTNALLDATYGTESYAVVKIIAHALLSLLSVDAALILAIRANHARRLTDASDERERLREERQQAKQAEIALRQAKLAESQPREPEPRAIETMTKSITYDEYVALNQSRNGEGPVSAVELKKIYGIRNSTAYRWAEKYDKDHVKKSGEAQ